MERAVVIAGAGPAGAAVAARLAQHGRADEVVVLERYRFPRDKPCGGGLTGHADQVLSELGLSLDVPHVAADDARVRYLGFERRIRLGKPVQVIRRADFDHSLVRQVERLGVEVVQEEGLRDFRVDPDGVTVVTTRGREIRAQVLVGADGAASVVRKRLAPKGDEIPHRLFEVEIEVPSGTVQDTAMLYDFSLMAEGLRGYSWVFPVAGKRYNVGLMHYPAKDRVLGGKALTELLRRGLADVGIELPSKGTRGWPVWGYDPKKPVSGPRVVTVGDAAGIDGLTGEGIAVAMEQSVIAGDAIDEALRAGRFDFARYSRSIRSAVVGRELNLDRRLATMLYGGERWREWLSLVLFDPDMLQLYATRVDGSEVLADQPWRLFKALTRHAWQRGQRRRRLDALSADPDRGAAV